MVLEQTQMTLKNRTGKKPVVNPPKKRLKYAKAIGNILFYIRKRMPKRSDEGNTYYGFSLDTLKKYTYFYLKNLSQ